MTNTEKTEIVRLREGGQSYGEISKATGIPVNSIKSFCRRNRLGGIRGNDEQEAVCEYCGKPVVQTKGRKKKRFCSDKCRNAWWAEHRNLLNKKANYECVCQHCGKAFISYGNKDRKYCSHECYIEERYGGAY